ncbi:hypothetical protein DFH08DRAFT_386510 [Mycena albidolilacea]|uniref:Xylanolytic transcriptional activator regulatory domain-containing protein n=1 Tax=Mycena albidolilacea TaxID=1033008 RepID=A0AAD6ZFS7_9AGAR|nr:hypothetical protein DFH08DRAFT_386510 [Mycena albidolilacea]
MGFIQSLSLYKCFIQLCSIQVHPVCGQCKSAERDADCEYVHGQKRARAEILQENIDQIKRRIYELEHPDLNHQPTVVLQQPYQSGTVGSPLQSSIDYAQWVSDEPPRDMVQKLVDFFLAYSSEVGFFLNASRFRESALLRHPRGHPSRPSPALLWTVYLWGLRLSKQPELIALEPVFLSRALNLAGNGLSGLHPQKVMHTLQAEILVAYYFFASGRFLEGKYHTASAVSLALSSGLHMIRSANIPSSVLPPSQDAIEEGERIHACWAVIILDRSWAAVLGEQAHLEHRQQIDTPWPLEADDYGKGLLTRTALYSNTLHESLDSIPTSDTGMSTIAMLSKASVLWQRADVLARDWLPDMTSSQSTAFQDSFDILDGNVDSFRTALIQPHHIPNLTSAMVRAVIVAHSIAHTATIKLQSIAPLHAEPGARQKRLVAATAVLNIIVSAPLQHLGFINPIMGVRWTNRISTFRS